jgi:hypothetical protein
MMKYHIAPNDWLPTDINPFSTDGTYGSEWCCFCMDGNNPTIDFCGAGENSLYTFRLGHESPTLKTRLADFMRYNKAHHRSIILSFPDDIDADAFIAEALHATPEQNVIREEDPKWIVHSTNLEAWESIKADGCLMALSLLEKDGRPVKTVGFRELGEPVEFSNYIMLGRTDSVNPEHVVASQAKGYIFTEANTPYKPGIRLYFDNHRIIEKGLCTRDGLHLIKVHEHLPLTPFMAAAIAIDDLDLEDRVEEWTPNSFFQAANLEFHKGIDNDSEGCAAVAWRSPTLPAR